ncbi:hypothetical protein [Tissierella creatinophila]|uniref:hypothetical protein n=1 Tax=Tissierella creatinophila TaxID=79681 RepID=UPI00130193CB|nr:hypothetical protein [Tissierella creatinophila]
MKKRLKCIKKDLKTIDKTFSCHIIIIITDPATPLNNAYQGGTFYEKVDIKLMGFPDNWEELLE